MAAEKKTAKAVKATAKKSATAKKPAPATTKKAAPAKAAPAPEKQAAPAPTKAANPQDEMRRRFEEALARKRDRGGDAGSPHDPGRTVVPQSNTKRQRTFRRKSGG
jgi:hypothetical protein